MIFSTSTKVVSHGPMQRKETLFWKNITNSQNSVRKKSFGGTFTFSNCHIIGLDTVGLVFLVSEWNVWIIGKTYRDKKHICYVFPTQDIIPLFYSQSKNSQNSVRKKSSVFQIVT
jgi:hypothetical protein